MRKTVAKSFNRESLQQMTKLTQIIVRRESEGRMLPTPREFCRHILSEKTTTTQAASNKRRLPPVSGGITA